MKKLIFLLSSLLLCSSIFAQTAKIPCSAHPEVKEDYDLNSPSSHLYTVDDYEISDLSINPVCTKEFIFKVLISNASYAAPGAPHKPIVSCEPIHLEGLGDIICVIDEANYTVTNYTMPTHLLRNGKVTRHLMQVGTKIVMRTTGVGTNTNRVLAFFNGAGPIDKVLWHYLDSRLKSAVDDLSGFNAEPRFSRIYTTIADDKSNILLLGKYQPRQNITLFETKSGKSYHCKTGLAHLTNVDCFGSDLPVWTTDISYQPNWFPRGGSPIQSTITVLFETNEFSKVTFSQIKNPALKWPIANKIAQAGLLKELLTLHPDYRQDSQHSIALNKPDLFHLDIPELDVFVATYPLDYDRESTVAAQFVVINGKAFHFTGEGVLDFSVFKLKDKYYLKSGSRWRTTIDQLFELTTNGLLPISTELYPCQ